MLDSYQLLFCGLNPASELPNGMNVGYWKGLVGTYSFARHTFVWSANSRQAD